MYSKIVAENLESETGPIYKKDEWFCFHYFSFNFRWNRCCLFSVCPRADTLPRLCSHCPLRMLCPCWPLTSGYLSFCFWGLGTWGWWSREMRGQLGWGRRAVPLWRTSCVSREMEKQQFPLLHLSYHGSGRPCASQHLFLPVSAISALHLVAWPHTPPQISLSEEFLWPQAVHPWSPSPVGRRRGVVPASSPTVFVGAVQSQAVSRKHNKN